MRRESAGGAGHVVRTGHPRRYEGRVFDEIHEIPEAARTRLRFLWIERVEDALAAALESGGTEPGA